MAEQSDVMAFVVRTPVGWTYAPLPGIEPVAMTVDEVCALLDPAGDGATANTAADLAPTPLDAVVYGTWMWVGHVRGDVLVVETADRELVALDAVDIRIVDAVGYVASVGNLAALDLPDVPQRVTRLTAARRVLTLEPAIPPEPKAVLEPPEDGPRDVGPWTPLPDDDPGGDRIPVYSIWHQEVGPMLSLGMLTANARAWEGGRLTQRFEIRRPETRESFLADLAARPGPAVVLCSNYVWSTVQNLEAAAAARELAPDIVIVHGGPNSPKYEADAARFLHHNAGAADILVRGEGEIAICELLDALESEGALTIDPDRLAPVDGLTFNDPATGATVRTGDRQRMADLDQLPSPYLTGEFDGIPGEAWRHCLSIETNRGCPYGCTFCDWGSATMSRIRKFSLDRVMAEFEWAARTGVNTVTVTDANFGIMARDVEFAAAVAEIRQRLRAPHSIAWTGAKNTTKHLVKIMDVLFDSGITISTSLSLQTTDPTTLEVLDRTNIPTAHYVKLAADLRRRGYPLQGDLMLGLPGQSFETYRRDLQFMLDHEIDARSWPVQLLPNSPMNDPQYRDDHQIAVNEHRLVTSTATFSYDDRRRMWRFRTIHTIAERMAVLRHILRYLQWDHAVPATDVMERARHVSDEEPHRYPLLAWVFQYFDLFPTVAVGWHAFYEEVRQFVVEEYSLADDDPGLRTVLELQEALMPIPGRRFPHRVELEHDYVAYYRSAAKWLYGSGQAHRPERHLETYPPATFVVRADPLELCTAGIELEGQSRNEIMQGDFHIGAAVANELDSDLLRVLPALTYFGVDTVPRWIEGIVEASDGFTGDDADEDGHTVDAGVGANVAVKLSGRRR